MCASQKLCFIQVALKAGYSLYWVAYGLSTSYGEFCKFFQFLKGYPANSQSPSRVPSKTAMSYMENFSSREVLWIIVTITAVLERIERIENASTPGGLESGTGSIRRSWNFFHLARFENQNFLLLECIVAPLPLSLFSPAWGGEKMDNLFVHLNC